MTDYFGINFVLILINYFFLHCPYPEFPIFPNPSVSIQSNGTLFLLQWSPPFLWPGHDIQYYSITVTNISNNSFIELSVLNATFSDALVSYVYPIDVNQSQMCTELLFGVTAITSYGEFELLSTFSIEGQYPASKIRLIFKSHILTVVADIVFV